MFDVCKSMISSSGCGPVTKPKRMPDDEPFRSVSIGWAHWSAETPQHKSRRTGTEDLGERIEPEHTALLPSVLRFEFKVARHEVVRVEREVVVRVVFEQEQVVLADEGEDRLATLERRRRSGRVRTSRTARVGTSVCDESVPSDGTGWR